MTDQLASHMQKLQPADEISFKGAIEMLEEASEVFKLIGIKTDPESGELVMYLNSRSEHYLKQSAEFLDEVVTQGRHLLCAVTDEVKEEVAEEVKEDASVS